MAEYAEVYCVENRKARKIHQCIDCLGTIPQGEIYHYHHGIHEHEPFDSKVCADCERLREAVNKTITHFDDLVCVGELEESVFERMDVNEMRTMLETKTKRGRTPALWMVDRYDDLLNKDEERAEKSVDETASH